MLHYLEKQQNKRLHCLFQLTVSCIVPTHCFLHSQRVLEQSTVVLVCLPTFEQLEEGFHLVCVLLEAVERGVVPEDWLQVIVDHVVLVGGHGQRAVFQHL